MSAQRRRSVDILVLGPRSARTDRWAATIHVVDLVLVYAGFSRGAGMETDDAASRVSTGGYALAVSLADRPLNSAVIKALTCWPGIVGGNAPTPADLALLPPFFNELLDELPWWNRAWRVTQVEPAYPLEIAGNESRRITRFTEVSVPGTVSCDGGEELPFFARVRFEDNRLTRFQAKIGDVILGPSSAAAGKREPHPFGVVLVKLMNRRGISIREMARRCGRAESTIRGVCSGGRNPHRILVAELAEGLGMPEKDLLAIAGLDAHPDSADRTAEPSARAQS